MSIYTYVVNHGKYRPSVGAATKINGGDLEAVMFDDALTKLDALEDFVNKLRDMAEDGSPIACEIDDFMN